MNEKPAPEQVVGALEAVIHACLGENPQLRSSVAILADWIGAITRSEAIPKHSQQPSSPPNCQESPGTPNAFPPSQTMPSTAAPETDSRPAFAPSIVTRMASSSATVPLRIGDAKVHLRVEGSTTEIGHARRSAEPMTTVPDHGEHEYAGIEPDLAIIAQRCALKARACDVVLARNAQEPGSAEEAQSVSEINGMITQAKTLPLCFLWAPYRQVTLPPEDVVRISARAYENVGLIAALTERLQREPGLLRYLRDGLDLFAEAQSALRIVLGRTWLTRSDQDQLDSFVWISRLARSEQIYVERFLRLDDPADPADHARLHADIAALAARIDGAAKKSKGATAALNKLKYHVAHLSTPPEDQELAGLRGAAEVLRAQEIEPEDKRVREIVRPLEALVASGADVGEYLVRAVGAATQRPPAVSEAASEPRAYSAQVDRVRAMLAGSVVVLAGGEVYGHARDRLIEAFALGDLEWCSQTEHGSSTVFESPIARAETRLVLVLVRLAGHQHIEDIRRWCRVYGKPLVMLPAGYNPEQVAAAVLDQVGGRLTG